MDTKQNYMLLLKKLKWLYYSIPIFLVISVYWLAFFPAIMSFDSVSQWNQILSGKFNNYNPAFHTIFMWLLTRIWLSPAIITLFQIIFFSITSGWGFSILETDLRIPPKIRWPLYTLYIFSPVNGLWVVTLWKDIPYSVAILATTLMVIKMILTEGRWLEKNWIIFGCTLVLVTFFRFNGPFVTLSLLFVLFMVYKKRQVIKYLSGATALLFLAWALIDGPLYSSLHVTGTDNKDPTRLRYITAPFVHLVAAHVINGTTFTSEEESFIKELNPNNTWSTFYICYNVASVMDLENVNYVPIYKSPSKIVKLALSLLPRNPPASLASITCRSDLVWDISQGKDVQWSLLASIEPRVYPNYFYIYNLNPDFITPAQTPILSDIGYSISQIYMYTSKGILRTIIWRPALYFYLGIVAVCYVVIRYKNKNFFLLLVPFLAHSLTVFLGATAQDMRYQYPVYLVFWVLMSLLWYKYEPVNSSIFIDSLNSQS